MANLGFAPHFQVIPHAPDQVLLLAEREQHVLTGPLYHAIAAILSQQNMSAHALADALADRASAGQVYYALEKMRNNGWIVDASTKASPQAAKYWSAMGIHADHIAGHSVTLVNEPAAMDITPLRTMLEDTGLRWVQDQADISLVIVEDYLDASLPDINRAMLEASRTWMLAKPVGSVVWIGPVVIPGQTACYACLEQRLRLNRALEITASPIRSAVGTSAPGLALAYGMITQEIVRYVAGDPLLETHLITFDLPTYQIDRHAVQRRPQCDVCGRVNEAPDATITLRACPVVDGDDGGTRNQSAEATFRQYAHHISPITGLLPYITRMPSPDPVYVVASGPNRFRTTQDWRTIHRHLRSQSAGKGATPAQARTSALCEALERYSGLYAGDEAILSAPYADIADQAVHPAALLQFSERQYAERSEWNQHSPAHLHVPQPFDETTPTGWTPAYSLTRDTLVYVPAAFAYFGYPAEFCAPDTNGNAAGTTLEEAILQGLFELIERDSIAIWWYNRLQRPAIDLDALADPTIDRLIAHYAHVGREMWVLDITTDIGVPACVAVSRRSNSDTEDIILGFGAHSDTRVAALRAITEMNQSLLAVTRDERGRYQSESPWEIRWWQQVTCASDPYLLPLPQTRLPASTRYDDIREGVRAQVERLRQYAMEVLIVNQTRPDVGLPVVKVIVPGLRHFWRRFAPGRLYDVPVTMGWLDAPRSEEQLNERIMFL